jgi:hypothetical protein
VVKNKELSNLQQALVTRLITLAEESQKRGELAESERLYREVLHFLELVVDANHVEIAKTSYKLAEILQLQEKYAESDAMLRRARQIIRHQAKRTVGTATS